MSDILCVTNRKLCREDFLTRIEKLAKSQPMAIILREKDLTAKEYKQLASEVIAICKEYDTLCILHTFVETARELDHRAIHLPLQILKGLSLEEKRYYTVLGASCHSVRDAKEAEQLGCTYITAGHVFDTDCKKGLPGRGLVFLKEVCENVAIPVYGIGGITPDHLSEVRAAGAAGSCVMSASMNEEWIFTC